MKKLLLFLLPAVLCTACSTRTTVCIYGGTSAAVTAAYSAAAKGCKVEIVCPDPVLGGMTTGGLGHTDIGNKQAVIGVSRDFYRKVGHHYGKLEQWIFEPHVASQILDTYLDNPLIKVHKGYYVQKVNKEGTRIVSIECTDTSSNARTFEADQFIDVSYEGDLMARAGVSYRVGREDNSEYGETFDGSQLRDKHQFPDGVDPFVVSGDPSSGLLWGISDAALKADGTGDSLVQSYNFRLCLTNNPDNLVPIERPSGYDSTRYELVLRMMPFYDKPVTANFFHWAPMPGGKTDINNNGPISTDMIGMNWSYPEASYSQRKAIVQAHKDYTLGLLYFMGHDPRVPDGIRDFVSAWGLPKDEYVTTGHWTHQMYVREARRMVGEYVATQADCQGRAVVEDGIGYAAYGMDSHNCERIVVCKDGKYMVKNEGDVQIGVEGPYPVSYRCLTPRRAECTNLLVPVCLSASHIAYGSIRMEPVFMELGQVCGLAAAMAGQGVVQEIDVAQIQDIMANDPYLDGRAPDIVLDEESENISAGEGWEIVKGWGAYGPTYFKHLDNVDAINTFTYNIPSELEGRYSIYTYKQIFGSAQMEYVITIGDSSVSVPFRQSEFTVSGQTAGEWFCLGTYDLKKGVPGTICPRSDVGGMITDAVLIVPQ